jgi:uncharacterized membrane protein YdjX (TVP38/TMEM64 family)
LVRLARLRAQMSIGRAASDDPKRRLALLLLLALPVAGTVTFVLGFDAEQALSVFQRHHGSLLDLVGGAPVLASLGFMALYAVAVVISLPGVGVLTVLGGYLFGWLQAASYVLIASVLAGSAVFLLARRALRRPSPVAPPPTLRRFAEGFRGNAPGYIFALHLVPIFPYAMVIGLPAACGVRLPIFVVSALLGLIPGTILLAHLGTGLGAQLQAGLPGGLGALMTPGIMLSLAGLALLALLPVAHRLLHRFL